MPSMDNHFRHAGPENIPSGFTQVVVWLHVLVSLHLGLLTMIERLSGNGFRGSLEPDVSYRRLSLRLIPY